MFQQIVFLKKGRVFQVSLSVVLAMGLGVWLLTAVSHITLSAALFAPPVVLAVNPAGNVHTATLETAVSVQYDQPISPTSITSQTFVAYASQTGLVTGAYTTNGNEVSLQPVQPFKPGELVKVTVTTGTMNLAGERPISPTVWGFRTAVSPSSGIFTNTGQNLGSADTRTVELGDLDGDGDLDAFVTSHTFSQEVQIWFNDGLGHFTNSGQSFGGVYDWSSALGDLDSDGDLDAITGDYNGNGTNHIWLNDGTGFFSLHQTFLANYALDIVLGDLDGDGDLDAFIGNAAPNEVWFNNGAATFSTGGQQLGDSFSAGVGLADLDSDGDLDVYAAQGAGDGADTVWLNDGTGYFSELAQPAGDDEYKVALGDVDGDGDIDAAAANSTDSNQLWLNDGTGLFVASGQNIGSGNTYAIQMEDVDGDADLDILTSGWTQGLQIWLNDGNGQFANSGQTLNTAFAFALGDLDSDGDLDAFLGRSGPDQVWLNGGTAVIPIAGLTAENSSPTPLGLPTHFVGSVLTGTQVAYAWNFGDGSTASGAAPSHTYLAVGVYTAVLTASNAASQLTATTTVTITDVAITGLFATNSSPTILGNSTNFTATVQSGSNITYTWEFGDGTQGSGATISHTYPASGLYTVTLTAINSINSQTATTAVSVVSQTYWVYLPVVTKP